MADKELTFSSVNIIYTVSRLTKEIKTLLEERYAFIWITGEISNYALPSSGHAYFSLKESDALISCIIFRNQIKRLNFNLKNGIKITGIARISIYEPKGTYSLIFEHIELQQSKGELQIRFEELKRELALEGLFDESHKQVLPFLPSTLWVITSITGAVIRDIIDVSKRRFPSINIKIVPVKVQGEEAQTEIKNAIKLVNDLEKNKQIGIDRNLKDNNNLESITSDSVIIIARGGGSFEDLSPFNSEKVARAVFESKIPIISAVGHETDFTICDLVADVRAATPSVAAEIAVPDYYFIKKSLCNLENRLKESLQRKIRGLKKDKDHLTISIYKNFLNIISQKQSRVNSAIAELKALSPMAVLKRGYSIAIEFDDSKEILTDATKISKGDIIEVILSKGRLICQVNESTI